MLVYALIFAISEMRKVDVGAREEIKEDLWIRLVEEVTEVWS